MPSSSPWACSGGIFDPDRAKARLSELDRDIEAPNFWNDSAKAQGVMRERQQLESALASFGRLVRELAENVELISLGEEEGDAAIVGEAEAALGRLRQEAHKREVEALLAGEADANDAYVEIHAGAGGTESQDWAQMLERMYVRWAEARDYKVNAYGWLKTESGVHRLVRISPFDSNARRHTSFASVWIYPAVDDTIAIDIDEKDVRIDTYRASGAGGQHVNTTDSAVRITHIPTNIVVQCQNERSQHKNRATAWAMLRARLYEAELKRREEEAQATNATKSEIGWGHQIRSYVLQPYQLVKDLRTGVESTNPSAVLDGDIDQFIEAALAERIHDQA